jgi:hypothetical protein
LTKDGKRIEERVSEMGVLRLLGEEEHSKVGECFSVIEVCRKKREN